MARNLRRHATALCPPRTTFATASAARILFRSAMASRRSPNRCVGALTNGLSAAARQTKRFVINTFLVVWPALELNVSQQISILRRRLWQRQVRGAGALLKAAINTKWSRPATIGLLQEPRAARTIHVDRSGARDTGCFPVKERAAVFSCCDRVLQRYYNIMLQPIG
jgi:hypothetical protein